MQTPKTYNSGIDKKLVAFIAVPLLSVVIILFIKGGWLGTLIILPIAGFIVHLFATTIYIISETVLTVKSGFFINIAIDINTIRKIEETNTLLSAPATSMDRLEIFYNKYDSVIISPKNKGEFINDILAINSQVQVIYKSSHA